MYQIDPVIIIDLEAKRRCRGDGNAVGLQKQAPSVVFTQIDGWCTKAIFGKSATGFADPAQTSESGIQFLEIGKSVAEKAADEATG